MKEISPVSADDISASSALGARLLALNNEHAVELSWLDMDRLHRLVRHSFFARRIGSVEAFLLAFDQDADVPGERQRLLLGLVAPFRDGQDDGPLVRVDGLEEAVETTGNP